jgi:hypothetical protein
MTWLMFVENDVQLNTGRVIQWCDLSLPIKEKR